ncbi:MAG: efflux RND transporter permease subunit [Bacteriovoracaceae bacterium]|nr:efflux RND transporter permease subunit [Bacteriovoracaceae bacterium]
MIEKHLKKPLSMFLFLLVIALVGIFIISYLPMKMYPNVIKPGFNIYFGHQDLSTPADAYRAYGQNIEGQLEAISEIENVESTYYMGRGRYNIECLWDIDEQRMKEKFESIFQALRGGDKKFWYNINSNAQRSSGNMMIAIGHKSLKSKELEEFLKNSLKPLIAKLPSVASVNFWSGTYEQHILEIDLSKYLGFNLNARSIIEKIKEAYQTMQGGHIKEKVGTNNSRIAILAPAKSSTLEDLGQVKLASDKNRSIKVSDIGKLTTRLDSQDSLFKLDGAAANYISVSLRPTGDVKRTCDKVEQILANFKKDNSEVSYNLMVNPATFIQDAIDNLLLNAFVGGLAAITIILLFLGTIQSTFIIALSIPFCVISSFILMKIFGVTINIISLGGMAIGVGMIVDSSIVALENIYRRLLGEGANCPKASIVIKSIKEVILPISASIFTSIVVFFPIIYTTSYTKAILGDLAKTVVFTLGLSSISALIIVPILAYRFLKINYSEVKKTKHVGMKLKAIYLKVLSIVIGKKTTAVVVISSVFIMLFASTLLISGLKKEIIAVPSTTLFDVKVELPNNDDIELTKKYALKVESYLQKLPEIESYATYFWSPSFGYVTARLKNRNDFKALQKQMKKDFTISPEAIIEASKWNPGTLPLPRKTDLTINISGAVTSVMNAFTDEVMALSHKLNASMHKSPWQNSSDTIKINFDPQIDVVEKIHLLEFIEAASDRGNYITDIIDDGKRYYIKLAFKKDQIVKTLEQLRYLPVRFHGKIVPLKALAQIEQSTKSYIPSRLVNKIAMQTIYTSFKSKKSAFDSNKESLIKKAKEEISKLERPADLVIEYPDSNKELNKSIESFKVSLLISLVLVFLILAFMFNSVKYPLIILITVPLALIGVITGLYVTSSTLSLNSMLGVILLSGLVVNNAILLIDFYLKERATNQSTIDSILSACSLRLRPILMTTLTSLFGVIPIALGLGESGEILQPLGISVFCGLLISTVLTLIIIPGLIRLVD